MTAIVNSPGAFYHEISTQLDVFRTAFPNQAGLSCDLEPGLGQAVQEDLLEGVAYLTVTSTTHTNAQPSLSPATAPPAAPQEPSHTDAPGVRITHGNAPSKPTPVTNAASDLSTFSNAAIAIIPSIVNGGKTSAASSAYISNPAASIVSAIGIGSNQVLDPSQVHAPQKSTISPGLERPASAAQLGPISISSAPLAGNQVPPATKMALSLDPVAVKSQASALNSLGKNVVAGPTVALGSTGGITGDAGASGTTIVLETNQGSQTAAVINGLISSFSPALSIAPLDVEGDTIYPDSRSRYVVSGHTLSAGATATIPGDNSALPMTFGLSTDKFGNLEAVVNGKTSTLASSAGWNSAVPIDVGVQQIYPDEQSHYVVSGETLVPGATITVAGSSGSPSTTIALHTYSNGRVVAVINDRTSALTPSTPLTAAPLVVAGETFLPTPAGLYVVSGQTLTPGSTITVPGDSPGAPSTTLALKINAQGQKEAIVNGQAATLTSSAVTALPLALNMGGETLLPNIRGDYVVDSKTLRLGGQITIPGDSPGAPSITILLTTDSTGQTEAIVNGQTSTLTPFIASSTAAPIVVDGQTITPNALGQYIVDGPTLSLDGEVTLSSGQSEVTVELTTNAAGHTEVAVNGHTSTVSTSDPSPSVSNYMISDPPSGGASTSTPFSGASPRAGTREAWLVVFGLGGLTGVLALLL